MVKRAKKPVSRHPGHMLAYLMVEQDLTLAELAGRSGLEQPELNRLLAGSLIITPRIADKLGSALENATFWITLQAECVLFCGPVHKQQAAPPPEPTGACDP